MPKPRSLPATAASPALGESRVVGNLQRRVQHLGKVAAIVGRADRRLVRHGVGGNEIAPADFGAIDLEHVRRLVGQPLQHVTRLGPAGAAIGIRRHRVGENAGDLDGDRRRAVDAGQQRRINRARDRGAEGRNIGAEIGDRVDTQCQEMSLGVERELGMGADGRDPDNRTRNTRCAWRSISPAGRSRRAAQAMMVSSG